MDYATLTSLNPSEFEDAAGGYKTVGDMAGQAKDDVENRIIASVRKTTDGQSVLEGHAADAAVTQLRKLATNFHYTQVECALITTALNSLAYELRAAKDKLDAAVEDAEAQKFTVGPDGSVSYPAAGDKVDGKVPEGGTVTGSAKGKPTNQPIDPTGDANDAADALERQAANIHPNPNFGRAVAIANRIAQAVYDATQADEKWAPKLRTLKADDDLIVSSHDWVDAQNDTRGVRSGAKDYLDEIKPPPQNGDPRANAQWWKGLSKDEQDAYLSMHPASLGSLDGIPSEVRDEANRIYLAETKAKYTSELADIPKEPTRYEANPNGSYPAVVETEEWKRWDEKYKDRIVKLNRGLDAMKDIQARFDQTGKDKLPPAYLLGFDPDGGGRAIVANGDPDTADHTAVFVPGTYTNLGKSGSYIGHMVNLWQESHALAPNQNISTITWIGYDAPQSIVPEAMSPSYAERAAPDLNRFLDGLQTVQGGSKESHTTVIGHSYGSTVVGQSSIDGKLAADDIVVAGSPGMRVGHADDLDVGSDHVWSEAASSWKDQVPAGGKVAGLGGDSDISWWAEMLPFGYAWSQNVPSDEDFGAHIMGTDAKDHGDYWRPASQSLINQAAVVTGNYNQVEGG
ncbi:alpha/beta hydrolase [Streptomyces hygroscopicus]|uniref:alpha/beta hydrolase n=1 Tax=Streptomyces hygroscopicus TaxID=1912 RepID=UPI00340E7DDE